MAEADRSIIEKVRFNGVNIALRAWRPRGAFASNFRRITAILLPEKFNAQMPPHRKNTR